MTPFFPTLIKASASTLPIKASLLPAIAATCWISFLLFGSIGVANLSILLHDASTALAIPRDKAIGSAPAAIIFKPSRKIASAKMVAVVVPSPATSFVLLAASFTIWQPRFSKTLSNSTSSATVTPSLVTLGDPQPLSKTAFRPRGPNVLRTARASLLTPVNRDCLALSSKTICFATSGFSFASCPHRLFLFQSQSLMKRIIELGVLRSLWICNSCKVTQYACQTFENKPQT